MDDTLRAVLERVRDGFPIDNPDARVLAREVARLRLLLLSIATPAPTVETWQPVGPDAIDQLGAMIRAGAKVTG